MLASLPEEVQEHARVAYRQFQRNPHHNSLRFKQIHTKVPLYSARISRGYRAVGQREGDLIVWFWIGPHAAYDQLLKRR